MSRRTAQMITRPRLAVAAMLFAAAAGISCPAAAQQVVVFVNGAPITSYDVEQRSKFMQLSLHKVPTRKEVIDNLIEEKVKVQEAMRYNMDARKDEVERAILSMASRTGLGVEQLSQAFAAQGVNIDTVRARMRAEIAWNQLVRARFPHTLAVGEKDIQDILETKKEGESVAYDYRLRPILFIVPKGSARSVFEGRVREAEALRGKFENCEDGISVARSLRDVAVRDPVRRSSADLPENLRNVLNNTTVGKLTKPEITAQGVEVFALCERKENLTDTPQKRNARQEIYAKRFEEQSQRYLKEVMRGAMIEYK